MLADHPISQTHNPEEPFRHDRAHTAQVLHDRHQAHRDSSTRQAARDAGVPHTTLHYWQQRQRRCDAPPQWVAFFEHPAGLAFLKQLLLALHLIFQQNGIAGIRPLCHFLRLSGLASFLAPSYGSQQKVAARLQALLAEYEREQRQNLAANMPQRDITLCEDENFHGSQPCLVAIEPLSNFLVLEAYHPQRDADTWNKAITTALEGLPVRVTQVTSDLARGLQAHARDKLGAQHSADLMHSQSDLHKGTSLPLQRYVEEAKEQLPQAQEQLRYWEARYRLHQANIRSPGRAPDFEQRLAAARRAQDYWQQQLAERQACQEQVQAAVRGLGDDYHPFDAQTGHMVSVAQMRTRLQQRFATIERLGEQAGVSAAGQQRIAKARRVSPHLLSSLAWFWQTVGVLLGSLKVAEPVEQALYQQLLPGLYWRAAAERGRTAEDRKRLRALASGLLKEAWSAGGVLANLDARFQEEVKRVCAEAVSRFVRASSCVEGRNGQLSLRHHGCHALSPKKLKALTVLHNYFVERADGSTAAERFFGQKPADLFDWLLERMPDPPRPAKRRPRTAKVAA
jgi:Family of unknown function (DUF6399)